MPGTVILNPETFDGYGNPLQTTWDPGIGAYRLLTSTKEIKASSANCTNVAGAIVSTLLLDANTNRLGASIHNDSTAILYLKFGTGASSTSFTVRMVPQAHYEVPFGYTGVIYGIWSVALGSARITEVI